MAVPRDIEAHAKSDREGGGLGRRAAIGAVAAVQARGVTHAVARRRAEVGADGRVREDLLELSGSRLQRGRVGVGREPRVEFSVEVRHARPPRAIGRARAEDCGEAGVLGAVLRHVAVAVVEEVDLRVLVRRARAEVHDGGALGVVVVRRGVVVDLPLDGAPAFVLEERVVVVLIDDAGGAGAVVVLRDEVVVEVEVLGRHRGALPQPERKGRSLVVLGVAALVDLHHVQVLVEDDRQPVHRGDFVVHDAHEGDLAVAVDAAVACSPG
eukprot:scaffold16919_cov72-Phaeocystis_antarctica.AAC.5